MRSLKITFVCTPHYDPFVHSPDDKNPDSMLCIPVEIEFIIQFID